MTTSKMIDQSTNAVATAAISSPVWLPSLRDASEVAGLLLPILGVAWLAVQIVGYLARYRKDRQ